MVCPHFLTWRCATRRSPGCRPVCPVPRVRR
jgi:hypothetical protein